MTFTKGEDHDPGLLRAARDLVADLPARAIVERVEKLTSDNERWRGRECLNLIAAEAPSSPGVRALLASELGTRASGGHIGPATRCFAGMRIIDEIEALCVELLKQLFHAQHADHRLMGGMAGCAVAYAALLSPGDVMMSLSPSAGGDSSGRSDGPAGVHGPRIVDIPIEPGSYRVDLDAFADLARRHHPRLIALNQTVALFPLPVPEMRRMVAEWGGRVYFDAAHQAGLIAGGCFPNPLDDGADVVTGSGGKTFSGPQSGMIVWNDPGLSQPITHTIFPVLTGSHQINRVAALAVAAAEMREFGGAYMRQTVANARELAACLAQRGFTVLGGHDGYTRTHQIMVDVRPWGTGLEVARRLEQANIIVNKMLLPSDPDTPDAEPAGIRLGSTEITRLGMREPEMVHVADLLHRVLIKNEAPEAVRHGAEALRSGFQKLHFCFEP